MAVFVHDLALRQSYIAPIKNKVVAIQYAQNCHVGRRTLYLCHG
jgi:hypothetical protein